MSATRNGNVPMQIETLKNFKDCKYFFIYLEVQSKMVSTENRPKYENVL